VLSAPGAITDVVATPLAGGTSVSLTWSAPSNTGGAAIVGYGVFYFTGSNWKYALSATNSATLTGLAKNTAYSIRVVASNGTYLSPVLISATAPATTLATVAGAPSKPVLTAGVKKVTVKWSAPADNGGRAITAYRIQRSTNGTTWTTLTSAGSASTRTFVATGLTTGVKYYFRVAAINPVGTSAYSAVNSVKAG
jgi:predicted phage tail protein